MYNTSGSDSRAWQGALHLWFLQPRVRPQTCSHGGQFPSQHWGGTSASLMHLTMHTLGVQAHRRMAKLKNDDRALGIKTKTPGIHTVPRQGTASFSYSKLYNMFIAKKQTYKECPEGGRIINRSYKMREN